MGSTSIISSRLNLKVSSGSDRPYSHVLSAIIEICYIHYSRQIGPDLWRGSPVGLILYTDNAGDKAVSMYVLTTFCSPESFSYEAHGTEDPLFLLWLEESNYCRGFTTTYSRYLICTCILQAPACSILGSEYEVEVSETTPGSR